MANEVSSKIPFEISDGNKEFPEFRLELQNYPQDSDYNFIWLCLLKLTFPWPLVPRLISSSPKKLMDPPKLTKSTFCGPLSLKFPTGDEIDREFPGPDQSYTSQVL